MRVIRQSLRWGHRLWAFVGLASSALAHADASVCPVTLPQKDRVGLSGVLENASLQVGLAHENFIFRPGIWSRTTADGSLRAKVGWNRLRPGRLSIEGRRLDAQAKPLRAFVPEMDHDSGFQPSTLFFPEPGCWEISGRLGNDTLTFVVLVMKIDDAHPTTSPDTDQLSDP